KRCTQASSSARERSVQAAAWSWTAGCNRAIPWNWRFLAWAACGTAWCAHEGAARRRAMGEFSAPAGRSAGVHVKMAAMTQEPRDEPLNAMENAGQPQYERADGEPAPRPPRRRFGHFVRGRMRQAWLNVQIWIPFLL